jgi:hypothetical protein
MSLLRSLLLLLGQVHDRSCTRVPRITVVVECASGAQVQQETSADNSNPDALSRGPH